MYCKSLMLGDWVQYNDGNFSFPTKIRGINEVDFEIEDMNCTSTTLILHHYIEPIPLTEEILKMNGFDYPKLEDGTEVKYVMAYEKDGLMWLNKEKDYFFISSSDAYIHIYFVHEIQHALRLCGLNELADNFKI